MNNTEFPEIVKQMTKRKETLKDIADLVGLTDKASISKKLSGNTSWSLQEVEILCKHYNIKFEKLFKRKED